MTSPPGYPGPHGYGTDPYEPDDRFRYDDAPGEDYRYGRRGGYDPGTAEEAPGGYRPSGGYHPGAAEDPRAGYRPPGGHSGHDDGFRDFRDPHDGRGSHRGYQSAPDYRPERGREDRGSTGYGGDADVPGGYDARDGHDAGTGYDPGPGYGSPRGRHHDDLRYGPPSGRHGGGPEPADPAPTWGAPAFDPHGQRPGRYDPPARPGAPYDAPAQPGPPFGDHRQPGAPYGDHRQPGEAHRRPPYQGVDEPYADRSGHRAAPPGADRHPGAERHQPDDRHGPGPSYRQEPYDPYRQPPSGPLDEMPTQQIPAVVVDPPRGPSRPARRRTGLLVAVLGTVLVLLLGAVAGYVLLERDSGGASAGRSPSVDGELADPTKVVDHWLNAMFKLKDPDEMLKYTCKREADRKELDEAVATVRKAEQDAKEADLTMKVSWTKPSEQSREQTRATVKSTLKVVVGKDVQETPANFDLVYEAGWKVCDAEMK